VFQQDGEKLNCLPISGEETRVNTHTSSIPRWIQHKQMGE